MKKILIFAVTVILILSFKDYFEYKILDLFCTENVIIEKYTDLEFNDIHSVVDLTTEKDSLGFVLYGKIKISESDLDKFFSKYNNQDRENFKKIQIENWMIYSIFKIEIDYTSEFSGYSDWSVAELGVPYLFNLSTQKTKEIIIVRENEEKVMIYFWINGVGLRERK